MMKERSVQKTEIMRMRTI